MQLSELLPDSISELLLVGIGLAAAFGFMARQVIQWYLSEKAGKVLSPTVYWQISLVASSLFIIYGVGRFDIAIILGQILSYYIYARNLHFKSSWHNMPVVVRVSVLVLPVVAIIALFVLRPGTVEQIKTTTLNNAGLAIFGTLGFVVMATRFVYQWWYSEKRKQSFLPIGFWLISMLGAAMLFTYGMYRKDIVLILSNSLNVVLYVRNIMIDKKAKAA